MKKVFEQNHDTKGLKMMNQLVYFDENKQLQLVDPKHIGAKWESVLLRAGCATTKEMKSDAIGIFFPQMMSSCYTFKEKINYWLGKAFIAKTPFSEEAILTHESPLQIPVYFISGYYDYTTPVANVELLYQNIEAPDKDMCIFKHFAHSPLWEETDAVLDFMSKHRSMEE